MNQLEGEGRYEDKQNHKLNKEKVREKDDTGYKYNDSKIGKTGSTTGNNKKTTTHRMMNNMENKQKRGKMKKEKHRKRAREK